MAEMARIWYLSAAGFCALLAMISMAVVWLDRERISFAFSPMVVDVLLGAAFGAIGSFMSLLTRSAEIKVAAGAGRTIHYVESISRITAGLVGALLVALAIKANLLLGAMATAGGLPLLLLVCIVAGASERLVPSLIARVESSALSSPAVGNSNSIARPARTRMLS